MRPLRLERKVVGRHPAGDAMYKQNLKFVGVRNMNGSRTWTTSATSECCADGIDCGLGDRNSIRRIGEACYLALGHSQVGLHTYQYRSQNSDQLEPI